jgi:hypothetical protein
MLPRQPGRARDNGDQDNHEQAETDYDFLTEESG